MSWMGRRHPVKERTVDPLRPSLRREARWSLLTLSPGGPWFYAIIALAQAGVVFVVTQLLRMPFGLTLATLFATEGIACMVVAWFLAGREGRIRGALRSQYVQVPVEGGSDLPPYTIEVQHDADSHAPDVPVVFVLAAYGGILLVLAFLLAV